MKVKINEEIKEYCSILKLKGIRTHFEQTMEQAEDYEEFLHRLLTYELEEKHKRSIETRIRSAHFPYKQYISDIETDCLPVDMQKKLPELATLKFIEKGKNIIMTGNPGTGKTMVSIALGLKACMAGYKVLFTTVPLLVTTLKESNSARTLRYFENRFEKYDLVIADELGYTSFDREGTDLLFNNLSLRAARKSTIVTTNLSFERWVEVFGDPTVTSAMVDRLTYKAILVDMEGESYRLRETLRENGSSFDIGKKVG
ncbi:MAG: IS21-like element helper ATPase IstB [Candidatus Izemoplasmatales bacterium]|nr:IS21-like element helper ATPase IstB [Candidatus Izemoplasmatales bacterium]